jgi:hypothetical protein
MRKLIFVVILGSSLLSISHGNQKLPQEPNSIRTAKDFQMKGSNLSAALDVRTNADSFRFTKALPDGCSINDRYGSCSVTCGVGKGVCKPGRMVVEEVNIYGAPKRTREYPPSCGCVGQASGPQSCNITDRYGSCSAGGDQGKAVCTPGHLVVEDVNIYGMPSRTREVPPICRFIGQGIGAESCNIKDRYGSCSATCDKGKAVCTPGHMVVLDVNKYGMPSRTKEVPPTCRCPGQAVKRRQMSHRQQYASIAKT